jgi:hypothetical protein
MICFGNLNKSFYFRNFRNKGDFTYVLESSALFYGNFCMNSHSVDRDVAMKR